MATSNRKSSKKLKRPQTDVSFDEFSDDSYNFSEEFDITPDTLQKSMHNDFKPCKNANIRNLMGNKPGIKPRTDNQKKLMNLIENNTITFAPGPAGTGKSFIAAYAALKMLWNNDNEIDKIVIIKPACEIVGEKLGYLPGTADDKISVYSYSTLNIIDKIIGSDQTEALVNAKHIVPSPLGYIRGCTFENCLPSDSLVLMSDGTKMTIEDILIGLSGNLDLDAMSFNIESNEIENKKIIGAKANIYQGELYTFELEDGSAFSCTEDHKVFTSNRGYVEANKLTVDDDLVIK